MKTTAKALLLLGVVLATIGVVRFHLESPTWFFPVFCAAAVFLYGAVMFGLPAIPNVVADAAYFSVICLQLIAIMLGIVGLVAVNFGPTGGRPHMAAVITIFGPAMIAPIALWAMRGLNARSEPNRKLYFWRGALAAVPALVLLYTPEYIWIKYHETILRNGEAADVTSSLHTLANAPFGRKRFAFVVCESVATRDTTIPDFMYDGGISILPDNGTDEMINHLRARFGTATQEVIETIESEFGERFLWRCSDWKNPNY